MLLKSVVLLTILLLLFSSIQNDLFSKQNFTKNKKKKSRYIRCYNPPLTKAKAIAYLQTSLELSELAKIGYNFNNNNFESLAYSKENSNENTSQIERNIQYLSDVDLLKTYMQYDEDELDYEPGEDADELLAEDDIKIDLEDFKSLWLLALGGGDKTKTSFGTEKESFMETIMEWLGTPYRFGGNNRRAIDCSAWVRAIFYKNVSILLPRTAKEQILIGRKVNRDKLEFGDIVFFHTYSRKFASHVGIYLGDNLFAHASSVMGVTVSSLNSTYYDNRFIGARRLSEKDLLALKTNHELIIFNE